MPYSGHKNHTYKVPAMSESTGSTAPVRELVYESSQPSATSAITPRHRATCLLCSSPAKIKRPKNNHRLCIPCFLVTFETEVHRTITATNLFHRGEHIAIGASGGKDSTVLASILRTLNDRYGYGLKFTLLSIDEGIAGYRDMSLATVKRNAIQYNMPLVILGYKELYGWTMDQVVAETGREKGGNCTYCGVFRRQALDRGAELLGVKHVVTGHNADDVAETVLMNLLRGDVARLGRGTDIVTKGVEGGVKRSKPLKYAYQKEIVLYAHHKKLDYFTTECTYSPEAFRGSARDLVKGLERIRPSAVLDLVRSGEAFAEMLKDSGGAWDGSGVAAGEKAGEKAEKRFSKGGCGHHKNYTNPAHVISGIDDDDGDDSPMGGGCGSSNAQGTEMQRAEARLRALEIPSSSDITASPSNHSSSPSGNLGAEVTATGVGKSNKKNRIGVATGPVVVTQFQQQPHQGLRKQQVMGTCSKCGYISSQAVCKACTLLEGLNRRRARVGVEVEGASPSNGGK